MGVEEGWYDPEQPLHRLVFHYVFIPWLQSELDTYRNEANDTKPRFDKNKVLPHGRPVEIFQSPEDYGTCDFAINVDESHLNEVRVQFAPPEHPVFHLVPPALEARAAQLYGNDPRPIPCHDNIWDIYRTLLAHFESIQEDADIHTIISAHAAMPVVGEDGDGEEYMALLPLRPPPRRVRVPESSSISANAESSESTRSRLLTEFELLEGENRLDSDEEMPHNTFTDDSSSGSSGDESDMQ